MEELVQMGVVDKDQAGRIPGSQPFVLTSAALLSVILHKHYLWPSQEAFQVSILNHNPKN